MDQSKKDQIYKSWAKVFIENLIVAAQVAISMEEFRESWGQVEFAPGLHELGYLDITNPQSGVCKLIRKGIDLGLFSPDELQSLQPTDITTPVKWRQ